MSIRNDLKRALDCALDSPATAAIAMVVLVSVPVVASSGAVSPGLREVPRSGAYTSDLSATYNYEMRCWQNGRLLFEQHLLDLPTEGNRYQLKVSGDDRFGHPVYVAETDHATCLIRRFVSAAAVPRG